MKTKINDYIKLKDQILFMSIGISGSGKGFYFKTKFLTDFPDVAKFLAEKQLSLSDIIVEPDGIRREVTGNVSDVSRDAEVWRLVKSRLKDTLKTYGYAILDATNVTAKTRKNSHKDLKVKKIAIVLPANVALSKERIKKDIENNVDRSKVPSFVIDRQYASYKRDVVGDLDWDGEWNKPTKSSIKDYLEDEFDEIKFTE